jgi:hypothetical protein
MIASALIAAIGKAESFAKGRDLAAWLGLVPKQSTTCLSKSSRAAWRQASFWQEIPPLRRASSTTLASPPSHNRHRQSACGQNRDRGGSHGPVMLVSSGEKEA